MPSSSRTMSEGIKHILTFKVSSTVSAIDGDDSIHVHHAPPTRSKSNTILQKVDDWWLWEVGAFVLACLSLLAIVILLRLVDGEKVPGWSIPTSFRGKEVKTKLTINAVVSIFSTILKSTIMIPIAASISQLKWLWFCDGEQNLANVQYFDGASKGPLGAVILLWKLRGRRIVCLGAIIIVIMLGLDFAFRSIVSYPFKPTTIGNDIAPLSQFFDPVPYVPYVPPPGAFAGGSTPETTVDIQNIITAAAYNVNTDYVLNTPCTTGNCTWQYNFATLAVCSECHELTTAEFNKTCTTSGNSDTSFINSFSVAQYCNYSWPSTVEEDQSFSYEYLKIAGIPSTPDDKSNCPMSYTTYFTSGTSYYPPYFHTFKRPLSVLSVMHANRSNYNVLDGATGSQCGLKVCVQKYAASMENNKYNETLLETFEDASADYNYTWSGPVTNYTLTPPPEFFRDMPPTAPRQFIITSSAIEGILEFIKGSEFWDGSLRTIESFYSFNDMIDSPSIKNLYDLTRYNETHNGTSALAQKFTWLAGNMTNAFRMHDIKNSLLSTPNSNPNGISNIRQNMVYVEVRWAWLALPALELLLTLLFLCLTIRESAAHNEMLWKGSALAPFYYPLTKNAREMVGHAERPREMQSVAEGLKIRWVKTESGLRLVHQ